MSRISEEERQRLAQLKSPRVRGVAKQLLQVDDEQAQPPAPPPKQGARVFCLSQKEEVLEYLKILNLREQHKLRVEHGKFGFADDGRYFAFIQWSEAPTVSFDPESLPKGFERSIPTRPRKVFARVFDGRSEIDEFVKILNDPDCEVTSREEKLCGDGRFFIAVHWVVMLEPEPEATLDADDLLKEEMAGVALNPKEFLEAQRLGLVGDMRGLSGKGQPISPIEEAVLFDMREDPPAGPWDAPQDPLRAAAFGDGE